MTNKLTDDDLVVLRQMGLNVSDDEESYQNPGLTDLENSILCHLRHALHDANKLPDFHELDSHEFDRLIVAAMFMIEARMAHRSFAAHYEAYQAKKSPRK